MCVGGAGMKMHNGCVFIFVFFSYVFFFSLYIYVAITFPHAFRFLKPTVFLCAIKKLFSLAFYKFFNVLFFVLFAKICFVFDCLFIFFESRKLLCCGQVCRGCRNQFEFHKFFKVVKSKTNAF